MLTMLVSLDKGKLGAASGKVVKADHFTRLMEANEIVAAANRHAAELQTSIETKIEEARKAGYEEGLRLAREEFAASIVENTAKINSAFINLEARIVNTVMNAVQQILGEYGEKEVMESIIRRVLSDARAEKNVRLRVSAGQFDVANEILVSILQEYPDIEFIDVVKDPDAPAGTCVLESEFGVIDASIETQLSAVRWGLIKAFAARRRGAGDPTK